jgi:nucleoside-diphosphate-sugar epimerase
MPAASWAKIGDKQLKIALIGATGYVGARLFSEAIARGHEVAAIARVKFPRIETTRFRPIGPT